MESPLHEHLKKQALYWLKDKVVDLCASEVKLFVKRKKLKADALGINIRRQESRIIEVKVSRSDFLRDEVLRMPYGYHEIADYAYIMTPAGLLVPDEVPPGYGLLEIDEFDNVAVRKNPVRNPNPVVDLEILTKRTARAATNAVLFKELSKEQRDVTKGAFARNPKAHLVNATCPLCKKRHKYLIRAEGQETVNCKGRGCKHTIPLDKARVHIVTSYNERFYKDLHKIMEDE
ncbi:hypothetical protein JSY36_09750 [Bacillus sp. H-16]|uniref:hypothetical protein n=1 Tax=Alteribacter salitolerans TaxID=2912333 RepID=UPI001964D7EF|nr:hypothetical protein [Alteribacter salitolerans]MBM7096038.1 hypothetical protein [Alteribacter salitolerans]